MRNTYNEPLHVQRFIEIMRTRQTSPDKPRTYTEGEMLDLARELGKKAAQDTAARSKKVK